MDSRILSLLALLVQKVHKLTQQSRAVLAGGRQNTQFTCFYEYKNNTTAASVCVLEWQKEETAYAVTYRTRRRRGRTICSYISDKKEERENDMQLHIGQQGGHI